MKLSGFSLPPITFRISQIFYIILMVSDEWSVTGGLRPVSDSGQWSRSVVKVRSWWSVVVGRWCIVNGSAVSGRWGIVIAEMVGGQWSHGQWS